MGGRAGIRVFLSIGSMMLLFDDAMPMTLTAEDVVEMSRGMMPDSGVYDPDYPRMNIHPDHIKAYRTMTELWNLLLRG